MSKTKTEMSFFMDTKQNLHCLDIYLREEIQYKGT